VLIALCTWRAGLAEVIERLYVICYLLWWPTRPCGRRDEHSPQMECFHVNLFWRKCEGARHTHYMFHLHLHTFFDHPTSQIRVLKMVLNVKHKISADSAPAIKTTWKTHENNTFQLNSAQFRPNQHISRDNWPNQLFLIVNHKILPDPALALRTMVQSNAQQISSCGRGGELLERTAQYTCEARNSDSPANTRFRPNHILPARPRARPARETAQNASPLASSTRRAEQGA
jgi:hypothetical protein